MIKYNNSNINDWDYGTSNIIKVYRNNAVCYYKLDYTESSGQTPCFAVVADISQYADREFEDVFNQADGKWYKLNNLVEYEEYGIYGSGRSITYYDGKLTIDGDYEYQYSGGSWVNVGEVSGSTQIIKSPEYIEKDSSHGGRINLNYVWKTNTKMQFKFYSTNNGGGQMIGEDGTPDNNDCRVFFASSTAYFDYGSSRINWSSNGRVNTLYEYEYGNYYIKNMVTSASRTGTVFSANRSNTLYLGLGSTDRFRTYYIKIYEGDTLVKDFIPWTDMNGNYGLFDKVSLSVYNVVSGYGDLTGSSNVTDVEVGGGYEYPMYYDEKSDPPDNVSFSSMTEAEEYECPWVGMRATIDGDKYVFSGDSQSGYEWVYQPSRLPSGYTEVEYVENTSSAYINTNLVLLENIGDSFEIKVKTYFTPYGNDFEYLFGTEQTSSPYTGIQLRYYQRNLQYNSDSNVVWTHIDNGDGTSGVTASCSSINATNGGNPLTLFCGLWSTGPWRFGRGKLYSFTVTKNNSIVRDLVPCTRDSDSMVGMYDIVNDVFYYPPNYTSYQLVAGPTV